MPHEISTSPDGKFIILKVVGDINRRVAMKCNLEAHALGSDLGIDRFLMDLIESRNTETVLGNYTFAYEDVHTPQINPKARVALLVAPDDHSHDFIEILSRNANLDVTLFRDRNRAIRHLRG